MHVVIDPLHIAVVWLVSAVFLVFFCLIMKEQYRVEGAGSWLVVILLGGIGGQLTRPIADLTGVGWEYAVPMLALGGLVSIPVVHFLLPKVAPDFQTKSFVSSAFLALWVGVAVLAAGVVVGDITHLIPGSAFESLRLPESGWSGFMPE